MTDAAISTLQHTNLNHLLDVEVDLVVELGRASMPLERARSLHAGDVIAVDMLAGQQYAYRINDQLCGEGDIDVREEQLTLRVTRLFPPK